MKGPLATPDPEVEAIEPDDDTPKAGEFLELLVAETVSPYERNKYGEPRDNYSFFYTDADGPVVSAHVVDEEHDEDDEVGSDGGVLESAEIDIDFTKTMYIRRWVFMAVLHVGSNYLRLEDLHGHCYRVHLDDWKDECRRVPDPDQRIADSVNHWQHRLQAATTEIGRVMSAVGIEGRQLASDTEALAVSVGTGPADAHKTALSETKEELPHLYAQIERAGKQLGRWMAARALPMRAISRSLNDRVTAIDSQLLAVDLYAGLSEDAKKVKRGKPAPIDERLHLFQRMHYMDEECLLDYEHGGMDYKKITQFDKWLRKPHNFKRLFPHPRCAVAFRVRRERKERQGNSIGDFIMIAFEEEQDRATFLYVRNGAQLWRVECAVDFGELLFPDLAHSTITAGQELWAKKDGSRIRTRADLEQEYGDEWEDRARRQKLHPFNDSSVYFDDMRESIAKDMAEYNRVALLFQGLLDRSAVLHPHPPVQLWDAESFDSFVTLVFDKDRAITAGEAPDFREYVRQLSETVEVGSFTIGQQESWWERERARHNSKLYGYREKVYSDSPYWWPGRKGPGFIAPVSSLRRGTAKFEWERKGLKRQRDKFPMVQDSIRLPTELLFNVSAYQPGDYKRFFHDPRTRADYLKWAPILLAAEDWHAGKHQQIDDRSHATPVPRSRYEHEERST